MREIAPGQTIQRRQRQALHIVASVFSASRASMLCGQLWNAGQHGNPIIFDNADRRLRMAYEGVICKTCLRIEREQQGGE